MTEFVEVVRAPWSKGPVLKTQADVKRHYEQNLEFVDARMRAVSKADIDGGLDAKLVVRYGGKSGIDKAFVVPA
jgi:hypothetical protein